MSRRISIVGLAVLCAMALSAVAASGASAAGTTAFTCVAGGGAHNTNADCQPGSTGTSGHEAIAANTSTTLSLTQLGNAKLTGTLFAATVELEATGVECVECKAENKEVGGVMEVTGSGGRLRFTGVTVVGLPNCEVENKTVTTEPLKFTTTSAAGVTLEPVTGTLLSKLTIKEIAATCNVKGTFKVEGKAAGTLNGSVLSVNVTKASKELTLEGEKASLKGEATAKASNGTTTNPVALTAT
jgi:hypothetical protein